MMTHTRMDVVVLRCHTNGCRKYLAVFCRGDYVHGAEYVDRHNMLKDHTSSAAIECVDVYSDISVNEIADAISTAMTDGSVSVNANTHIDVHTDVYDNVCIDDTSHEELSRGIHGNRAIDGLRAQGYLIYKPSSAHVYLCTGRVFMDTLKESS